jgi:hypothetical protein
MQVPFEHGWACWQQEFAPQAPMPIEGKQA